MCVCVVCMFLSVSNTHSFALSTLKFIRLQIVCKTMRILIPGYGTGTPEHGVTQKKFCCTCRDYTSLNTNFKGLTVAIIVVLLYVK